MQLHAAVACDGGAGRGLGGLDAGVPGQEVAQGLMGKGGERRQRLSLGAAVRLQTGRTAPAVKPGLLCAKRKATAGPRGRSAPRYVLCGLQWQAACPASRCCPSHMELAGATDAGLAVVPSLADGTVVIVAAGRKGREVLSGTGGGFPGDCAAYPSPRFSLSVPGRCSLLL